MSGSDAVFATKDGQTYAIRIKRVADGEQRWHDFTGTVWRWGPEYTDDFQFMDGNWSCDCNRYLDFERAGGANEADLDLRAEDQCGDRVRYHITGVRFQDGTEVEVDW